MRTNLARVMIESASQQISVTVIASTEDDVSDINVTILVIYEDLFHNLNFIVGFIHGNNGAIDPRSWSWSNETSKLQSSFSKTYPRYPHFRLASGCSVMRGLYYNSPTQNSPPGTTYNITYINCFATASPSGSTPTLVGPLLLTFGVEGRLPGDLDVNQTTSMTACDELRV